MKYVLDILPEAHKDLLKIHQSVSQNSPKNALAIITDLLKKADNLKIFPNKGVKLSGKFGIDTDLQILINSKYPYITAYRVVSEKIDVVRILPSRSEYLKTLGL
ncbi:MAG: type II toxin-antitoxin system RelE/ParE family toxin [Firmicutes bacterium]|nr:type II toxin-antitoxin system RelE/ParE family toxin [Bacillota bacterium]